MNENISKGRIKDKLCPSCKDRLIMRQSTACKSCGSIAGKLRSKDRITNFHHESNE